MCYNAVKRISISIEHMSFRCEDGFSRAKMSLQGDSFFERGIVRIWVEQILPNRLDMGMVLGIEKFGLLHLKS